MLSNLLLDPGNSTTPRTIGSQLLCAVRTLQDQYGKQVDVYFRSFKFQTRPAHLRLLQPLVGEALKVVAGSILKGASGEEGQYPDEKSSQIYPQLALSLKI